MTHLDELIVMLAGGIPHGEGGPDDGVRVEATSVDLAVPVETQVGGDGLVRASLPRGRLATGHDVIHSRLAMRFDRSAS